MSRASRAVASSRSRSRWCAWPSSAGWFSAPKGAAGMHGWAPGVIGAIGTPKTRPEEYLNVIFTKSASSQQAGKEALGRMYARTLDRDQATTWATREAQYDAACAWGIPDHALLQRLSGIDLPVFVANGDNDPMILARRAPPQPITKRRSRRSRGTRPGRRSTTCPPTRAGSCRSTSSTRSPAASRPWAPSRSTRAATRSKSSAAVTASR
jgi:hypothetical protein